MITKTPNQIAFEIDTYIRANSMPYGAWYVGIACDPRDRLFNAHCVAEKGGCWIYRNAGTDSAARAIEKYFIDAGCKGGPCGGDNNTTFIYAYLIAPSTCE
jgi:hypothetical protein